MPLLLEKSLERGWRVAVQGTNADRLSFLDGHLWTFGDESFLPHGQAGDEHEARQPILLTTNETWPNNPDMLLLIDGAECPAAKIGDLARVCVLFDGNDEAAISGARSYWRALSDAGITLKYWYQENRAWKEKKL